jgi:hypothetical protein
MIEGKGARESVDALLAILSAKHPALAADLRS